MSVKPILKHGTSFVDGTHQVADSRHMKWDEGNLKENQEYMDNNPKMKIDEPDTPFVEYKMEDDQELKHDEETEELEKRRKLEIEKHTEIDIHARLVMAEAKLNKHVDKTDDVTTPTEKDKEADFKNKRRAVYADEGAKYVNNYFFLKTADKKKIKIN